MHWSDMLAVLRRENEQAWKEHLYLLCSVIGGAVDREDRLESGDLEDLENMRLERREDNPAIDGLEAFGGDEQHPEPSAADVVELFSIDHQASFPAIDQMVQPLREAVRGARVQLSVNPYDTNLAHFPFKNLHDVPPLSRLARPRSAACS